MYVFTFLFIKVCACDVIFTGCLVCQQVGVFLSHCVRVLACVYRLCRHAHACALLYGTLQDVLKFTCMEVLESVFLCV